MLNSFERLLLVREVPIFKELRDDFLVRLASIMKEESFAAQNTIFSEGQEGLSMYVIVAGKVRLYRGNQKLDDLTKGGFFGEMALFDAEPRSASVIVLEPCDCLVLTQQQLYEAIDETPEIALNLIKILSRRIRRSNQKIQELEMALRLTSGPVEPAESSLRL